MKEYTMRKLLLPLFAAAALFSSQASADWTGKDAANATITFKNPGVCTAVVCVPVAQLYDGTNVVTLTTAGADAVSNTLTGVPVYSRNVIFNGTTWDRWVGDTTNGAWVNVKTSVLPTGAATSALQTSAAAAKGEGATGAAVPSGAQYMGINSGGNLTGWNGAVTQSGTWTVQPGNTANTTPWLASVSQGGNTAIVKAGNTFAASDVALGVSVVNTNANGQAALASSSPVAIAKNSGTGSTVAGAAVGTAGSAAAEVVTVQGVASMTPITTVGGAADPCQTIANSRAVINIGTATTTRIITPSASNKTYICSVDLFAFAANNVAIIEGTGGTCGTGTAGVVGGTTTATGISFPAQGGLAKGGAGFFVWNTAGTNVDFCLVTSTTGPLTGFVKYVQAP